jgi:low temperature requirement protein LtrA
MNTKLLILLSWIFYFALLQTADEFWRFCLVYSCVLVAFSFFYRWENKSNTPKNKDKSK